MAAVAAGPWPPQAVRSGKKRYLWSTLGWALLALGLVVWAFTFRPTQLGGPATYVVVSGDSMEPTLSDGDLVILKAQDAYSVGDIATFAVPEGEPGAGTLVIHLLVDVEGDAFVPQGTTASRSTSGDRPARTCRAPCGCTCRGAAWSS